ncbi:MAG: RluA family pseudouridine synthase [Chloroflexi bacterium]|nr:RluA family pseudouridine synthase [Chloroflexota bacterium]
MTAESRIRTLELGATVPIIRLDKYAVQALPQFSRSHIQKLIDQGYILVNGQRAKASQRLNANDSITIELPPTVSHPVAEPIPLTIAYEDGDIVVIDKPAGLTVHPAPGHPNHTLVNAILAHCSELAISSDSTRPGIVHRLDKDTSGLMVVAKNEFARQYLVAQFKSHAVTKGYLVLVRGKLLPDQGRIEAPIGRDPRNRQRMAIVEGGKEASTEYKVRKHLGDCSFLEVSPETGRTHQIRVHLSAIGHPVVGDAVYGAKSPYVKRQFIHAYRLGFCLPKTGKYQEFTCALPRDLKLALQSLGQKA